LKLKILVIETEINFDLNVGLKMEKVACDFFHLTSTSFSVLPVVVIRLSRFVKAVTLPRITPAAQLMSHACVC